MTVCCSEESYRDESGCFLDLRVMDNVLMTDPRVGGTVAVIQSMMTSLNPSERRVAEECVAHPWEVAALSSSDLAARCSTSTATVIRACQAMGFKGFQHLRMLLMRDAGAAIPHEQGTAEPGTVGAVQALFTRAARNIENSLGSLNEAEFDRAVAAVAAARRVVIIATGSSVAAAQAATLRFIAAGIPVETPTDPVAQTLTCRLLGPEDVVIAISNSGMNQVTLTSVQSARSAGACVIGITSYARSHLSEQASIRLVAGAAFHTWQDDAMTSNVVQLLLLDALHLAVAATRPETQARTHLVAEQILDVIAPE